MAVGPNYAFISLLLRCELVATPIQVQFKSNSSPIQLQFKSNSELEIYWICNVTALSLCLRYWDASPPFQDRCKSVVSPYQSRCKSHFPLFYERAIEWSHSGGMAKADFAMFGLQVHFFRESFSRGVHYPR